MNERRQRTTGSVLIAASSHVEEEANGDVGGNIFSNVQKETNDSGVCSNVNRRQAAAAMSSHMSSSVLLIR